MRHLQSQSLSCPLQPDSSWIVLLSSPKRTRIEKQGNPRFTSLPWGAPPTTGDRVFPATYIAFVDDYLAGSDLLDLTGRATGLNGECRQRYEVRVIVIHFRILIARCAYKMLWVHASIAPWQRTLKYVSRKSEKHRWVKFQQGLRLKKLIAWAFMTAPVPKQFIAEDYPTMAASRGSFQVDI